MNIKNVQEVICPYIDNCPISLDCPYGKLGYFNCKQFRNLQKDEINNMFLLDPDLLGS